MLARGGTGVGLPNLLERLPLISRSSDTLQDPDLENCSEIDDSAEIACQSSTSSDASQRLRNWHCPDLSDAWPYGAIVGITAAFAFTLLPGWPAPGCGTLALQECICPIHSYWCLELAALFAGVAAAFLLSSQEKMANKSHVRSAAHYAVTNWIAGMTTVVGPNIGGPGCFARGLSFQESALGITFAMRSFLWLLGQLWMQQLVLNRICALEAASMRSLGGRRMRKLMHYQLLSMALMCGFILFVPPDCMKGRWFAMIYTDPLKSLPSLVAASLIVGSTLFCFAVSYFAMKSLFAVVRLLQQTKLTACTSATSVKVQTDVCQALSAARCQLAGVIACMMMSAFVWAAFGVWSANPTHGTEALNAASQSLDTVAHALAAIFLSGGHRARTPHILRKLREGTGRSGPPPCECLTATWQPDVEQTSMGPLWDDKVKDLASRAITVEALLRFYRQLGNDLMSQFAPDLHTTHDVVRQAIIPLTKASRSDCALILMQGSRQLPKCMITHNWSNRFRDLVACVVAHVLQECSYQLVANLLDEDISVLERLLVQSGQSQYTCWICCFAVNQHAAICASPPKSAVDPVTGLQHPACDCGLPKVFNSDGMLAHDGRSIDCEMNKFDDVMTYLAQSDKALSQCVAIDTDFNVFSRAWCIAEAVEGCRLGIKQSLVVPSRRLLDLNTPKLLRLRVQEMEASWPEDKELILAKILDKDEFNKQLQSLIFDRQSGLLAMWHHLDTEQQMGFVGRLLRWHGSDDGSGVVWRNWDL